MSSVLNLLLLKSNSPKWIKLIVSMMLNNGLKFETVPLLPPHWLPCGQGQGLRNFYLRDRTWFMPLYGEIPYLFGYKTGFFLSLE